MKLIVSYDYLTTAWEIHWYGAAPKPILYCEIDSGEARTFPGGPKLGRKWETFKKILEILIEIWGKSEEIGTPTHSELWGWLHSWKYTSIIVVWVS